MLKRVKLWAYMCWFEAQRFRAYPLEIVAGLFSRVAEFTLYSTFWIVVGATVAPGLINTQDILGYYMITTGLTPFFYAGFGIASMMHDMIKSGELNQTLIRPISPILTPWATRTGRNAINLLFGAVQVTIGVVIVGGFKAEALPMLLPVLFNTAAINASFNIGIGAISFYTTEGRGFKNVFLHLASFLRGERMPIYLMEPGFAAALMLTPFPASMYHLVTLVKGSHMPSWGDVFIGTAWAIALLVATVWFWRSSLKKYEAVGL